MNPQAQEPQPPVNFRVDFLPPRTCALLTRGLPQGVGVGGAGWGFADSRFEFFLAYFLVCLAGPSSVNLEKSRLGSKEFCWSIFSDKAMSLLYPRIRFGLRWGPQNVFGYFIWIFAVLLRFGMVPDTPGIICYRFFNNR